MSIKDIRNQLAAKQQQRAKNVAPVEKPIQIHHGHDAQFCYMQINPLPENGVVRFTLPEYQALQAEMKKVEASFTKARQ